MRRVVVDMQNALFADAIATARKNCDSDFEVYQSESPAKTKDMCVFTEANILIMEVTAYTPWKLEGRMEIRNEVKAQTDKELYKECKDIRKENKGNFICNRAEC